MILIWVDCFTVLNVWFAHKNLTSISVLFSVSLVEDRLIVDCHIVVDTTLCESLPILTFSLLFFHQFRRSSSSLSAIHFLMQLKCNEIHAFIIKTYFLGCNEWDMKFNRNARLTAPNTNFTVVWASTRHFFSLFLLNLFPFAFSYRFYLTSFRMNRRQTMDWYWCLFELHLPVKQNVVYFFIFFFFSFCLNIFSYILLLGRFVVYA